MDSYSTSKTLIGIDEKLKQNNYQMLIANTSLNIDREIESIYSLAKQKVAGIILLATEVTGKTSRSNRSCENSGYNHGAGAL